MERYRGLKERKELHFAIPVKSEDSLKDTFCVNIEGGIEASTTRDKGTQKA